MLTRSKRETLGQAISADRGSSAVRGFSVGASAEGQGIRSGRTYVSSSSAFGALTGTANQILAPLIKRQQEEMVAEEQARAQETTFGRATLQIETQGRDGNVTKRDAQGVVMPVPPNPAIPTLRSQAYADALKARYQGELKKTALSQMSEFRRENMDDPQAFGELVDAYISATIEAAPDEWKGITGQRMRAIGDQMMVEAVEEKAQRDWKEAADLNAQDTAEAANDVVSAAIATQGLPITTAGGKLSVEPGTRQALRDFEASLVAGLEMGSFNRAGFDEKMYSMQHNFVASALMAQLDTMDQSPEGRLAQVKLLDRLRDHQALVPEKNDATGEWELRQVKLSSFMREEHIEKLKAAGKSGMAARAAQYEAQRQVNWRGFQARAHKMAEVWRSDPSKLPSQRDIVSMVDRLPWDRRGAALQLFQTLRTSAAHVVVADAAAELERHVASGEQLDPDLVNKTLDSMGENTPADVRLALRNTVAEAFKTYDAGNKQAVASFGLSLESDEELGLVYAHLAAGPKESESMHDFARTAGRAVQETRRRYAEAASAAFSEGKTHLGQMLMAEGTKRAAGLEGQIAARVMASSLGLDVENSTPQGRKAANEALGQWAAVLAEVGMTNGSALVGNELAANEKAVGDALLNLSPDDPMQATLQGQLSLEAAQDAEATRAQRASAGEVKAASVQQGLADIETMLASRALPSRAAEFLVAIRNDHKNGSAALDATLGKLEQARKAGWLNVKVHAAHLRKQASYEQAVQRAAGHSGVWSHDKQHGEIANERLAAALPGRDLRNPDSYHDFNVWPDDIVAVPDDYAHAARAALESGDPQAVDKMIPGMRDLLTNPQRRGAAAAIFSREVLGTWDALVREGGDMTDKATLERARAKAVEATSGAGLKAHDPEVVAETKEVMTERAAETISSMFGKRVSPDDLARSPAWNKHLDSEIGILPPAVLEAKMRQIEGSRFMATVDVFNWSGASNVPLVEDVVGRFAGAGQALTNTTLSPNEMAAKGLSPGTIANQTQWKINDYEKTLAPLSFGALFDSITSPIDSSIDRAKELGRFAEDVWNGRLFSQRNRSGYWFSGGAPTLESFGISEEEAIAGGELLLQSRDPERGDPMVYTGTKWQRARESGLVMTHQMWAEPTTSRPDGNGNVSYKLRYVAEDGSERYVVYANGEDFTFTQKDMLEQIHGDETAAKYARLSAAAREAEKARKAGNLTLDPWSEDPTGKAVMPGSPGWLGDDGVLRPMGM